MPNNTNANIPANLEHAPAQKVGGMRVKAPDARRTSLKEEESKDSAMSNEEGGEVRSNEEQKNMEEEERLRIRALQERQAQDMQNHMASRQPDVTKNAGSNVKQQYNPNTQPRAMNH